MEIYKSEEQTIVLTKKWDVKSNCDIEQVFEKPIIINEDSEIGILEISLPKSTRRDDFSTDTYIYINLLWKQRDFLDIPEEIFTYTYVLEKRITFEYLKGFLKTKLKNIILPEIKNIIMKSNGSVDILNQIDITPPFIDYNTENYFLNKSGGFHSKTNGERWGDIYITFDRKLHKLLGFDPEKFPCIDLDKHTNRYDNTEILRPIKASFVAKDFGYFDNFYIYSNIVSETYVGNVKANILRVFSRIHSEDDIITYNFHNIFFVPLRVKEINSIKIQICDSFGDIAIYDKGDINIVLIIKPIK